MIDRTALKAGLTSRGINATDAQVEALAADVERETEFARQVRAVHDNLKTLDVWVARHDPDPAAKRAAVQHVIEVVESYAPSLPAYAPAATETLKR